MDIEHRCHKYYEAIATVPACFISKYPYFKGFFIATTCKKIDFNDSTFFQRDNWVSKLNWRLSFCYQVPVAERCLELCLPGHVRNKIIKQLQPRQKDQQSHDQEKENLQVLSGKVPYASAQGHREPKYLTNLTFNLIQKTGVQII